MRKVFIIIMLVLLLFVVGCSSQTDYKDVNYFEGNEGLVFSFIDNSPPLKVYPEQTFPITIKLENVGAFSLIREYPELYYNAKMMDEMYASATIIYDPFYFEENKQTKTNAERVRKTIYMEGKSAYWPTGESRLLTLGMLTTRDLGSQRIGADTDVKVSMCFPYETQLATEVCVGTDTLNERVQPCDIESLSFTDQGAPVAVTHVEVLSIPLGTKKQQLETSLGETYNELVAISKPVFRLTLENVGSGQIIRGRDHEDYKSCLKESFDDTPSNSVKVMALLGNKELDCSPEIPIFRDNHAEVSCTLKAEDDISTNVNYLDILQVYLDYVYQVRESVTVEIDDSYKQYVSPKHLDLECMDFDFDYPGCQAANASGLDCYYCDALNKCFTANECDQCSDGEIADKNSRLCVSDCPTPYVSQLKANYATKDVVITCAAHSSVNILDGNRCSCDEISYFLTEDPKNCEKENFYTAFKTGIKENGKSVLSVDLSGKDLQYDGSEYLCVQGRLTDSSGQTKYTAPRYIKLQS